MKTGVIIAAVLGTTALGLGGVYVYKQRQEKKQMENQNTLGFIKPQYKKGDTLYANKAIAIDVKEAVKKNSTWSGTNSPYGVFDQGEKVGVIEESGIVPDGMEHSGEPFYIVRKCMIESVSIFGLTTPTGFCDYGVVIESQVKIK